MRVDGGVEAGEPPEAEPMQTGFPPPAAPGLEIVPPKIDRRSSSPSSGKLAGFLPGFAFARRRREA